MRYFNYNLLGDGNDVADFLQRLFSFGFDVPCFDHMYMDHHGFSELDILASFGLIWVRQVLGPLALVDGQGQRPSSG